MGPPRGGYALVIYTYKCEDNHWNVQIMSMQVDAVSADNF